MQLRSDPQAFLRIDPVTPDLTRRSVRGGAVTIASQVAKVIMQFSTTIVLARLLRPEAFGLVAMVAALLGFLEMFKDLGLSAATVQRANLTSEDVSTLFWVNAGLGVVVACMMVPLAPLLAWLYHEPALIGITLWFSLGFALSGLSTQHLALLRRQMRFSLLASILMGAEIVGMAAAIAAAYFGADYWALVLQRLVWALCLALGGWIFCSWRPGKPAHLGKVRDLLGFGGNVTGYNLITLLARNLDQILLGWYWGPLPLGLYDRAYKILLVPINNLNAPLFSVAMPVLSRLADQPERYRRAYLGMIEKLNMVAMPSAVILITASDLVVHLLFGAQWMEAAPIVAWLGVAALYQPLNYTCSWLFMTQDRTPELLHWGWIGSAINVLGIISGLPFGAVGVAAGFALSGLVKLPCMFYMIGRRGPVSGGDMLQSMLPSALAAILVATATYCLRQWTTFHLLTPGQSIGLLALLSAAVTAVSFWCVPQSRQALRDFGRLTGAIAGRNSGS
jgi:PST family polysaccharide transporter